MTARTPEKLAGKDATREMVRAVGGVEAAAQYCRLGKSALHRDYDVHNPDHATDFVPIDVVMDLERLGRGQAGWPHVTRALARAQGFALVQLPDAEGAEPDWHSYIAQLSTKAGEIVGDICKALSPVSEGGVALVRGEAARIVPMVETGLADLAALQEALKRVRDGG